jgi:hypothetical protein
MTALHNYRSRLPLFALLALLGLPLGAGAAQREFDHAKFDALLSSAVSGGRVDYAKFRASSDFTAYLASLENASVASLSTDEQLAFWINAYNALVIRNVLDNPGMKRPVDVKGFFDGRKFKVAGRSLTLNDIENTMIRAKFHEPLIHFGLVCAARSCPPLGNRAFAGRTVRAQLARNAAAYLASPYNRYDASHNRLELSKIFDWYKGDFGGDAGIREFVKKYGTPQMKSGVSSSTAVGFMEYDWTLNAR